MPRLTPAARAVSLVALIALALWMLSAGHSLDLAAGVPLALAAIIGSSRADDSWILRLPPLTFALTVPAAILLGDADGQTGWPAVAAALIATGPFIALLWMAQRWQHSHNRALRGARPPGAA